MVKNYKKCIGWFMKNTDNRNIKQFLCFMLMSFMVLQLFNTGFILLASKPKTIYRARELSVLQKDNTAFASEQKIELSSVPITLEVWNESPYQNNLPEKSDIFIDQNQKISGCSNILLYNTSDGTCRDYELESYVVGTLLAEMPTSYNIEALKAQAVACRTYAVYKLLSGVHHDSGANLCTSPGHCQAFVSKENVREERYEIAKSAVDQTKGIIMFYDKKPILSVFHSSCDTMTNSSAEVWGGERAYLQSVETWESYSPEMDTVKTYVFKKEEFLAKIKRAGVSINDITELSVTRNPSGKTVSLNVSGNLIKGETAASCLGLRSCDFDALYDANDDKVVLTVYGHGHGVGMSQKGAQDLAQKGYTFNEILMHYYRGISFGITE